METTLLTEVEYIDGVQEFLEEGYVTELLGKTSNRFQLAGMPVENSVRFSGDTSLFSKQVFTKQDLEIEGAWMISGTELRIHEDRFTSEYTYTYITYKRKATTRKEGLFSVDYDNGYLYTSTPIKDVRIIYKYAVQYVEGQRMKQVPATEYNYSSIYNIPTDDKTKLTYLYQVQNTINDNYTKEYYSNGRVNLVTLGDKDE